MSNRDFTPVQRAGGPGAQSVSKPDYDLDAAAVPSRSRLIGWSIASAIVLIAIIAIAAGASIFQSYERAIERAERELQNTSFVLAAKIDSTFEVIERVQANVMERIDAARVSSSADFEQRFSGYDTHLMLKDKLLGLSHVGTFTLVNAEGKLFNFSRAYPAPSIDVSDRSFFQELRSDASRGLVISEPIRNRATGTWVVQFARKITAAGGQFAGILMAAVELEQFENEFQRIVLGPHSSISLFREGGVLLARFPRIDSLIGRTFRAGTDKLGSRRHGAVRVVGGMEGKDRVLGLQRLERYPFLISVGIDTEPALASWRREGVLIAAFAFFSAALVAAISVLIVRQLWRRDAWSRQRVLLEKQRLDTAINNMTQGLLLFDISERIVVCNRRYIEMYELDPAVVKPGCDFRRLIEHRKETGSFSGDVEAYRTELLRSLAQGRSTQLVIETPKKRTIQIVNQPLAQGGWVATHEDITERKRAEERASELAHYDTLTSLPNRRLFREHLEQQLNWVNRGSQIAVLYLDLDHFKSVNDTLGHPVGDALLTEVSARLRSCIRDTDLVSRLGGDEFAVIQTGLANPSDASTLALRILQALQQPFDLGGQHIVTNTSIGIAIAPDDGTEPDGLLKNADLALYGAKANGRGTYQFFEPGMDARAKARRAVEFDIRQSLMCGGFELYYQPIFDLRENRVAAYEALLRWHHPTRGLVSPAEFISVAEETGLINQLGEWVLNTACTDAAQWPADINIAVNVSPIQFKSRSLGLIMVKALSDSGLAPHRLELEITEAVLMHDHESALKLLSQLRERGVRVAMDDFGTGYSSLSYLQKFPIDKIKIDRSFIHNLTESESSVAIVRAVIDIAKVRDMVTTAEGVETDEQLALLRRLGCSQIQGYLLGRPMPLAEIPELRSVAANRASA
jgi:diguanylate cyclase (GGDEF)-like protein